MFNGDILGDDGRAALHTCVKVKIIANPELRQYDPIEAQKKVKSCFFKSTIPTRGQTPSFPFLETKPSYDICDIKAAVDNLERLGLQKLPRDDEPGILPEGIPVIKATFQENNRKLQDEYDEATQPIEIEHGTGFIIADGIVVTNHHVIESVEDSADRRIIISNQKISDLDCVVLHSDTNKDLALLHVENLNLSILNITPLLLSDIEPPIGIPIFVFGYPFSHRGNTALLTQGYVSGTMEGFYGRPKLTILNCPLNAGNSGGPIMQRVNGLIRIVGVAKQKHFKTILTIEEMQAIEEIRAHLNTAAITTAASASRTMFQECSRIHTQQALNILTLKLYDALETHSQFNLSNAITGPTLIQFIRESLPRCSQEIGNTLNRVLPLISTQSSSSTSTASTSLAKVANTTGLLTRLLSRNVCTADDDDEKLLANVHTRIDTNQLATTATTSSGLSASNASTTARNQSKFSSVIQSKTPGVTHRTNIDVNDYVERASTASTSNTSSISTAFFNTLVTSSAVTSSTNNICDVANNSQANLPRPNSHDDVNDDQGCNQHSNAGGQSDEDNTIRDDGDRDSKETPRKHQ
jgi:hypothetical protein